MRYLACPIYLYQTFRGRLNLKNKYMLYLCACVYVARVCVCTCMCRLKSIILQLGQNKVWLIRWYISNHKAKKRFSESQVWYCLRSNTEQHNSGFTLCTCVACQRAFTTDWPLVLYYYCMMRYKLSPWDLQTWDGTLIGCTWLYVGYDYVKIFTLTLLNFKQRIDCTTQGIVQFTHAWHFFKRHHICWHNSDNKSPLYHRLIKYFTFYNLPSNKVLSRDPMANHYRYPTHWMFKQFTKSLSAASETGSFGKP